VLRAVQYKIGSTFVNFPKLFINFYLVMPKMISTFVTRAVFCNSDGSVSICTFVSVQ